MDLPINVLTDSEADSDMEDMEGMLYFAELTKELYNDSIESNDIEELGSMLGIVFKVMTDEETNETDSNDFDIEQETDISGNTNIILTYESAKAKSDFEKKMNAFREALLLEDLAFFQRISEPLYDDLPHETKHQQEIVKTLHRPLWKLKTYNLKTNSKFLKLKRTMEKLTRGLVQERDKSVDLQNKLTEAENRAATSLEELTLAKERETTHLISITKKSAEIEVSTESMKLVLEQFQQLQEREASQANIIELNMIEMASIKSECDAYKCDTERMEREMTQLKQKLVDVENKAKHATDKWKQKFLEAEKTEKILTDKLEIMTQRKEHMSLLAAKTQKEADQSNELVDSLIIQLELANKNKTLSLDLVESELECSICSELFVCPTTLNCAHTFCKHCLDEWKRNGSLNKCPMCRNHITSEQKCLVLESYINKLMQNLPEDAKKRRQDMIEQRNNGV